MWRKPPRRAEPGRGSGPVQRPAAGLEGRLDGVPCWQPKCPGLESGGGERTRTPPSRSGGQPGEGQRAGAGGCAGGSSPGGAGWAGGVRGRSLLHLPSCLTRGCSFQSPHTAPTCECSPQRPALCWPVGYRPSAPCAPTPVCWSRECKRLLARNLSGRAEIQADLVRVMSVLCPDGTAGTFTPCPSLAPFPIGFLSPRHSREPSATVMSRSFQP